MHRALSSFSSGGFVIHEIIVKRDNSFESFSLTRDKVWFRGVCSRKRAR